MWLNFMFDLGWSSLFFFAYSLFRYHPHHCFWFITFASPTFFSYLTYSKFDIPLCIILAHLIINLICFIVSLLIFYSHWAPSGPWLTNSSIHVAFYTRGHGFLIIEYLGLVSFHFYYPITLAYVMSRVLRSSWGHGIRCRLRQPLLRQVFEIWLIFRYHHAFSSGRCLYDVWTWFNYGYKWLRLDIWWWMIRCSLIFSIYHTYDVVLGHIFILVEIYRSSWSCMIISTYEMKHCLLSYHDFLVEPFLGHSIRPTLFDI